MQTKSDIERLVYAHGATHGATSFGIMEMNGRNILFRVGTPANHSCNVRGGGACRTTIKNACKRKNQPSIILSTLVIFRFTAAKTKMTLSAEWKLGIKHDAYYRASDDDIRFDVTGEC